MNAAKSILLVDDEKSILFAVRNYFSAQGHPVDCASTAEEALDLLTRQTYTLAIVDVNLRGSSSGMDGLHLASFLRQNAPSTIIIILTALETPETERRAAEVGVHSFLRKPARLAHLADVASGLMRDTSVAH